MIAKPFLHWVGGKRRSLPALRAAVPAFRGVYHEPFVGGGAMFFDLAPSQAVLSDSNLRLIRAWRGVRDDVEIVIDWLRTFVHSEDFFYRMRDVRADALSDSQLAAWFIYLNRTGFNGLYRENRSGAFNVPWGKHVKPPNYDEENLRACSRALQGVALEHEDFCAAFLRARPGDLIYCDPPYVPLSETSNFTAYTARGFSGADQVRLRDAALDAKSRGVHVLLSNSVAARELYAAFEIAEVPVGRSVNCKGDRRGKVVELLIR